MKTKNLTLGLNVLLVIAVAVLFVLHFADGKNPVENVQNEPENMEQSFDFGGLKIAYVNTDSLLYHYKLASDLGQQLVKRKQNLEAELSTKSASLEKDFQDLQTQVQKVLITRKDAQEKEQELMVRQQKLVQLQNELQNKLLQEEQSMNQQVFDSVTYHILMFNKDKKYDYVLNANMTGSILYGADKHNITKIILDRVNEGYEKGKK